jgi:putative endonuclease
VFTGFSAKYGVDRLVWYEAYERIDEAIAREKALKKWRRAWKIQLIEEMNPEWIDLYATLA